MHCNIGLGALMARERIWTGARDAILIRLHRDRRSYTVIAGEMGISPNAAAGRIAVLIRRGVLSARSGKWVGGDRLYRPPVHRT
jgi:hypothetical protein